MNPQNRLFKLINSKYYYLLFFFISFLFITLFSRSTSALYATEGFDAAIFKQMGMAFLQGKTMYVDYFDNKGCLLYLIQALGLWLGGNFFILLMQVFSMTITFIIWDKMLALYQDSRHRIIGLGVMLLLLLCFYAGGDLSEEWCLPFASYPLWIYFKALKEKKEIPSIQWWIIGICFGIIAFIRINNACPFLGFALYAFFNQLKQKNYRKFFSDGLLFLSGTAMIAGICLLFFYMQDPDQGIKEMIYGTFLFNFEYLAIHKKTFLMVFYILFLALSILQQVINSYHDKAVLIPCLLSYTLFVLTFGTHCFTHYLISLLPLSVVMLMTIRHERQKNNRWALIPLSLVAVLFYLPVPVAFFVNDVILGNDKYAVIYNDFHQCIDQIPETERDSIYNYNLSGSGVGMMQNEGLLQCNRVFYTAFAFEMPILHQKETEKSFQAPPWILVSWDRHFEEDDAYFILGQYDEVCSFEHNRIYWQKPQIGNTMEVKLYRRK